MISEFLNIDEDDVRQITEGFRTGTAVALKIYSQVIETALADKTFFKGLSKVFKAFFDELVAVGFTEEQAMQILTSPNIMSLTSGK